jgi:enamine deaminase RidA (YjgF/YER057c/UK114 family)
MEASTKLFSTFPLSLKHSPLLDRLDPAGVARYSILQTRGWTRIALMLTPIGRGSFQVQLREILAEMEAVLNRQPRPLEVTAQTVFLRDAADRAACEALMESCFGERRPVTNYVPQPPCSGAAVAIEAWAIGGEDVTIRRFGKKSLTIEYDRVRRIYCGDIAAGTPTCGVYAQTTGALERMRMALADAGADLHDVVRTWFYLGKITGLEGHLQRYQELNRARADYYRNVRFSRSFSNGSSCRAVLPASTGIGTTGSGLAVSCVALQARRPDVFVVPLENPRQTPAYVYHPKYSSQSPKFSRAVALVTGNYITIWVSGTASIVGSESQHPNDVVKQTEQTIDNIETLISSENFERHHIGAGASLQDFVKIRVYVKRPEDYACCRAICERRFGNVPAVYAVADICRPELLVEIEGMVMSRYAG